MAACRERDLRTVEGEQSHSGGAGGRGGGGGGADGGGETRGGRERGQKSSTHTRRRRGQPAASALSRLRPLVHPPIAIPPRAPRSRSHAGGRITAGPSPFTPRRSPVVRTCGRQPRRQTGCGAPGPHDAMVRRPSAPRRSVVPAELQTPSRASPAAPSRSRRSVTPAHAGRPRAAGHRGPST